MPPFHPTGQGLRLAEVRGEYSARATCPYCGVGCVVDVTVEDGAMRSIGVDPDVAPNYGMMCPKGALLFKSDDRARRVTRPMVRDLKGGPLREVTWDEAIGRVVAGLRDTLAERGPDAVAWYGSGQLDTEASYLFTKLFKGYLGSNQTDTNSRLCMSSAVAGYVHSFGSDGPPTCYDDFEAADTFFLIGANMTANHPVLFNRVRRRRATKDGTRIIVVDPRRTKTAEFADLHLAVRPGGDVALLRLLAWELRRRGGIDHDFVKTHTEGHAAFDEQLDAMDRDAMLDACGVPMAQIEQAAAWMAPGPKDRRLLSCYCMGTNQSSQGTDKNTALIDLHLMTGQVGKPGAGPFSLTGQPNAMGGREVGYLAHQLPGYRLVSDDCHRAEVEDAWGLPRGRIAAEPGRPAVAMFDAAARGELGVLWVACTNPAVSMPDLDVTHHGLAVTPLVVVQDCLIDTETAAYADVILPAATWGEKRGTMTNSERLVMRSRQALDPPGTARADWRIVAEVGRAMGFPGFDFDDSDAVWDEFRRLTAGRPCDMTGITNARLDAEDSLHWPFPEGDDRPTLRRYTDGVFATSHGRARFGGAAYTPPAEATDAEYPLTLTTGRVASQWHTRGRTGAVRELNRLAPHPVLEIHPDDADAAGLTAGGWAAVVSRRGRVLAEVKPVASIRRGLVFVPFHYGATLHGQTAANHATHRAVDPKSKQPELKHAAVRLEPAEAPVFERAGAGKVRRSA
ncbi:MAG: nitrate reductase [Planctomycetota bacterium]